MLMLHVPSKRSSVVVLIGYLFTGGWPLDVAKVLQLLY